MKRVLGVPVLLSICALAVVSCAAWAAQKGITLALDGKIISTDVQTIQGRAYVPMSDVARILDRSVVKKGGAYSLMQSTSGDPRTGLSGKMGSELVFGPWRLKITSAQQVAT